MVLRLASAGAATTSSIANRAALVAEAALLVQQRAQIRPRLSLQADFLVAASLNVILQNVAVLRLFACREQHLVNILSSV
jgi:hypothetical protein